MITKPTNWDTYLALANSYYATTITVYNNGSILGSVYTYADILSCEMTQSLYGETYGIGGTVMNQITFTIDLAGKYGVAPKDLVIENYFPKMAGLQVGVRVVNDASNVQSGTAVYPIFTTNKPDYDKESGFVTVTAYDPMYLANVVPFEEGATLTAWDNPTLRQVANHIVSGTDVSTVIESNFAGLGQLADSSTVTLEDDTQITNSITMGSIPYGYTAREILGEIALACCGNWTIVSGNKLRLVGK